MTLNLILTNVGLVACMFVLVFFSTLIRDIHNRIKLLQIIIDQLVHSHNKDVMERLKMAEMGEGKSHFPDAH
jgi:hypothetical protein